MSEQIVLGDLLTYGIPNMKLEKDIVERRDSLIDVKKVLILLLNTEVGKDITAEELKGTI